MAVFHGCCTATCLLSRSPVSLLIHHNPIVSLPDCQPLQLLSLFFICAAVLYEVSAQARTVNDSVVLPSASLFQFVNISVSVIHSIKISPMCQSSACLPPQRSTSGLMAVTAGPGCVLLLLLLHHSNDGDRHPPMQAVPLPASFAWCVYHCSEVRQSSGVHAAFITESFFPLISLCLVLADKTQFTLLKVQHLGGKNAFSLFKWELLDEKIV